MLDSTRRTVLKAIGASVAVGTIASSPAAASGGTGFTTVGVNKFDFSGDGDYEVEAEQARDPAGGTRGSVTHVFSTWRTTDYLTTVANVDDEDITLGDFGVGPGGPTRGGGRNGTLQYDYYAGGNNDNAAPDEAWLLLVEPDGTEHEVFHTKNDGEPSAMTWKTRYVGDEIRNADWYEATSNGVQDINISSLPDDTEVNRVGAGRGNTSNAVNLDIYFHKLRFNGKRIGTFPTETTD